MSAKYEASSPVTLIAGETVASGARGKLVGINAAGRAVLTAAATSVAVGTVAQDAMTLGEPVTVNQLQGKLQFVAGGVIAIGFGILYNASGAGDAKGKVLGVATIAGVAANTQVVGVSLEPAVAHADDGIFQGLALPAGFGT